MTSPTISPIMIGRLLFDLSDLYRLPPDHPESGRIDHVPIFCYHIALPNRSILVDAPRYEPDYLDEMLIPGYEPPPSLLEQLGEKGINPAEITDVIITHRHFDHYNGITRLVDGRFTPIFPNARHYLGRGDWQPDDFWDLDKQTLVVIHREGLLELVGEPTAIGDGLTIVPKPGETPGHQILALDNGGRRTYFTGDLYHHEIEFEYPDANVYWAQNEAMRASKRSFLAEAAAVPDCHIYIAHIPGPNTIIPDGDAYRWQPISG